MWLNGMVERGRAVRLLSAAVAGFGGLLAVAILSDVLIVGLPKPVHAEASAPAFVALCFEGPGGEFLNAAYVGQRCR
jgi:hypothetical protein